MGCALGNKQPASVTTNGAYWQCAILAAGIPSIGNRSDIVRPRFQSVVRLGLLAAALGFGLRQVSGKEPAYGIIAQKNVMVPMRDGVKLATDIYLPARDGTAVEGRFPVVLSRTPYGKEEPAAMRTPTFPTATS